MRVLAVTPLSVGLVHPMIGIALELRELGHEVAFASGTRCGAILRAHGLELVAPSSAEQDRAMIIDVWTRPDPIALQVRYVGDVVRALRPDLILASTFALGALLVAQVEAMPVAVLGLGAWLWPSQGAEPNETIATNRATRAADVLAHTAGGRRAAGLPDGDDRSALIGDLFLLQNAPALAWPSDRLPERVVSVGACLWEPRLQAPELDSFLAEARGRPLIYVQPGRNFGQASFWRPLVEAVRGTRCRVVASIGRQDGGAAGLGVPAHGFFVRQHVPQGPVLPSASLVVMTGHTTAFLGAAYAGVPMLIAPTGSGSEDIAELAQALGISLTVDPARLDAAAVKRLLERVLRDEGMRARSAELARALGPVDGCRRAAEACVALGAG